jgi:hypothetical protein
VVVAYDSKSRQPVINEGYALARANHKNWNILGVGGIQSGSVHDELSAATGELDTIQAAQSAAQTVAGRTPWLSRR